MRFQASRGLSDEYRALAEGHSPWAADAVDPWPVLIADVAAAGFDTELERAVRNEGIAALAFVPLVHGDRLLGKFMLYHDEPREWGEREIRLCRTIASHIASAVVRTRARIALRDSREQLETIMRTVDEGIIVQSPDGRLVYANDAAARTIGFESTADLLANNRSDTLARFDMLDSFGNEMNPDDLPGRRALRGESSEELVRYRIRATGEERWSVVRANPVYGGDGTVVLAVSVIHDVTETKVAEERLRFLGRGSEMLNETLHVERTLAALAALAVPTFAGHVTVDLYEDGVLRCVGARHLDPAKTDVMIHLREQYPPTVEAHPVQRAIRTGEPQFIPDVQAEAESMAHDPEHTRAIHDLGNESGIVVPLTARGRTFGAITFGSVPPQPAFTESDFELAIELGRRASVALDNALLHREVEARAHAAEGLEFVNDGVFLVDGDGIVPPLESRRSKHVPREGDQGDRPPRRRVDHRLGDREQPDHRGGRADGRRAARRDVARRGQGQRALALHLGGAFPGWNRLRVPRHDGRASGRAVEERLRFHHLARAADAARGDLWGRAHTATQRRAPRRVAADRAARRHLGRGRPPGAHRQRHPVGEQARLGPDGHRDRELRRRAAHDLARGAARTMARCSRSTSASAPGSSTVAGPALTASPVPSICSNGVR